MLYILIKMEYYKILKLKMKSNLISKNFINISNPVKKSNHFKGQMLR